MNGMNAMNEMNAMNDMHETNKMNECMKEWKRNNAIPIKYISANQAIADLKKIGYK